MLFFFDPSFIFSRTQRVIQFESILSASHSRIYSVIPFIYLYLTPTSLVRCGTSPEKPVYSSILIVDPTCSFCRKLQPICRFLEIFPLQRLPLLRSLGFSYLIGTGSVGSYLHLFHSNTRTIYLQNLLQLEEYHFYRQNFPHLLPKRQINPSDICLSASENKLVRLDLDVDIIITTTGYFARHPVTRDRLLDHEVETALINGSVESTELDYLLTILSDALERDRRVIWKPHPFEAKHLFSNAFRQYLMKYQKVDYTSLMHSINQSPVVLGATALCMCLDCYSSVPFDRSQINLSTLVLSQPLISGPPVGPLYSFFEHSELVTPVTLDEISSLIATIDA